MPPPGRPTAAQQAAAAAQQAAYAAQQKALQETISRNVAQVYEEAEGRMVALLARRAAAGRASGYDEWARRKAAESARFAQAARQGTATLTEEALSILREGLTDAYGLAADAAQAQAALLLGQTAPTVAGVPRAVELLMQEAAGRLAAARLGMLRQVNDVWQQMQAQVAAAYATGTLTLTQAIQQALDRFAGQGLTRFVDSAGRSWGLQEYAEMSTRTATARAQVNGAMDRFDQLGHDLVIVSDSPDECPLCRPWEGKVLSRSGQPTGGRTYPTVGQATAAGLFHPNCTHGLGLWVPGLSRPMRRGLANPQGYDDRMRERALERRIRGWKRRQLVAMGPAAEARARRGLARSRADYRAFIDRTGRIEQPWRRRLLGSPGARPPGWPLDPTTPRGLGVGLPPGVDWPQLKGGLPEWLDALTPDERRAIGLYTQGSTCERVNGWLQAVAQGRMPPDLQPGDMDVITNVRRAVDKARHRGPWVTWRGVRVPVEGPSVGLAPLDVAEATATRRFPVGAVVQPGMGGFASTSANPRVAMAEFGQGVGGGSAVGQRYAGVVFEMQGRGGAYLPGASAYDDEYEMLYGPLSRFRVLGHSRVPFEDEEGNLTSYVVVHMKELP